MNRIQKIGASVLYALVLFVPAAWAQSLPDFTGLVADVSPAVVNVSATRTAETMMRNGANAPQLDDDDIPEIFRRYFGQPGAPVQPRDSTSLGTGFIISADGYVLTNHHVIDGADEVVLRLADRRELDAEVVGSDPATDIALLKIEATGLPVVKIGDSDALQPGQWVVAIGSPFGFDHSVTAGVVSATGRPSMDQSQQYVPFIQTDVAINRGNSGGPLLNTAGEVVGINSQIFSNTGGFMGVSFAIPVETAMNSVKQLKSKGYVSRGLLGVRIQDLTRDLARSLGLPRTGGALVFALEPGGAAEKAGVKVRDVILAFDGTELARSSQLPPLVGATEPGSRATLTVYRDGKELQIPVTVGEAERDSSGPAAPANADAAAGNALGIVVEDIAPAQREALGLDDEQGVVIARVVGAPGRRAGLSAGDIVLMVGKTAVATAAQFNAAVKGATPGEPVMLLVRSGQQTQFVAVMPDADD
ncbi:Do family serine endopeptidase [Chiayiivirga flava]|uniref:Probable periplasmic serine endoprotease DegP-like n=1 Tax=Chiayiivirga flava TaxID=659595 RepID=A0A7W8D389_9GAMM|nr:Do family serine endopeptidase [Chiayiivirga flava]MBB5207130.1 serine protease Do [Chiayiivirga flava]